MIDIEVISDATQLAVLLPEWEALWQRDAAATPFQWPGWVLAWWRFFGSDEPVVLAARRATRLVGLLPLYRLREGERCKLLPIGIGLSDYIEALVDPVEQGVADLLLIAIARVPEWDECWLPDLIPEGALATAIIPARPGWTDAAFEATPCLVLGLMETSDRLAAVPRKTRRDVHQARRRAEMTGDTKIEAVGAANLAAALNDLFELHQRRWQERGEHGVCSDPHVQQFHRTAAAALADAGMLRLYRLWVGDRVLAVYYGFAAKGVAYAYLGGFDPSLPRLSPGMQVIAKALEQASDEGAHRFDFLRGDEAYKYAWGAANRRKVSRRLTSPCPD